MTARSDIQTALDAAVRLARKNKAGKVADYIPELAKVTPDQTAVVVQTVAGKVISAGDVDPTPITLQSVAKLIVLIGMLEEYGLEQILQWVKVEPSGADFASIARLDQFGPLPSNPMLNSGAIALCSKIPGHSETQIHWLETWAERLFGEKLTINAKVFASERRTGDRNRSLAYLLKSNQVIDAKVEDVLQTYFALCSFEATVTQAACLPMILANAGKDPQGNPVVSEQTALQASAIMATCGLYNETGAHMVRTGLPGKSGVSGIIVAVAPGKAGIATASPRVNSKGTSIGGEIMLAHLSETLGWHFAR